MLNRRRFLAATALGTSGVAGCLGGGGDGEGEQAIQDSDGDGVIDSEDYAPDDPDVQEKADLVTSKTTATTTTTTTTTTATTTTPTTTTTTATTTSAGAANEIQVTDDYWTDSSHISAYDADGVTMVMDEGYPETDYDRAKLLVGVLDYPRGDTLGRNSSEPFDRSAGRQEFEISIDTSDVPSGQRVHYLALVLPADKTLSEASSGEIGTVMETDPFVLEADRETIRRSPHPKTLRDETGDGYSRNAVEGAYNLEVAGRTSGQDWTVNFFGFKSAYVEAVDRSRGRSRKEYVSYELTDGLAGTLAAILDDEAEANGFTDQRDKVEFIIDFVQRLPYVPDDVSKGFDDYTKFVMETTVEMGGDCEDTAIMLAAVLEAEPFDYDMILIQPPGHMAAGIWQEDPSGYYYEFDGRTYAYIETTGEGWGIGDSPEQYKGVEAYLFQV